jgi:hypothetical protein
MSSCRPGSTSSPLETWTGPLETSDGLADPSLMTLLMSEASQRAIDKKLSGGVALRSFVRSFRRADGGAVPMALVDRHIEDGAGSVVGIRTAMVRIAG